MLDGKAVRFAFDKRLLAVSLITVAFVVLLYRAFRFGGYFPDDAFITFRFSEHLSQGLGIVWNVDGPPVDGSTTFLLVILSATAYSLGLSAPVTAYIIATVSVLIITAVFCLAVIRLTGRFNINAVLPLVMFVASAHFSVHAISGMETVLFVGLLGVSFLTALDFVAKPRWTIAILLAFVNFLCLWCRPDAAPYLATQGAVLTVIIGLGWQRRGDMAPAIKLVSSFAILIVLGSLFLLWKYSYFGYVLPNSYYVKAAEGFEFQGAEPVWAFVKFTLSRIGLLLPLLLFVKWRGLLRGVDESSAGKLALLIVPTAMYLLYNTTVLHIVGFFFRFEYPVAQFFWIGAAWLLTSGNAFERLEELLNGILGKVPAFIGVAILGYAVLAASLQLDRKFHAKWFSYVQTSHYEPIAQALKRSGAGSDGTLVFDSAGYIPSVSGFSLIDPIGLTDNVLSGRDPITAIEREEYIWGANPDVYLGPVPPATDASESGASDPIIGSDYVQSVLLKSVVFVEYRRILGGLTYEERREVLHFRMRELRDRWIPIGEVPYSIGGGDQYTHFLYVRRDSPFAASLVEELSRVTTRPIEAINFDDIHEGQIPLDVDKLREELDGN